MKLLKIFLLTCMVMVTSIYGEEGSQPNVLWHNSSTGAIKIMPIKGMLPEESLSVVTSSNTNLVPRGMGDFTGDGKPDILFHNQNSGNLRIWKMDGAAKIDNIQILGSSNTNLKIAGVGDFDGDGDNDIATFNTNSGALRIWVMDGITRIDNVLVLTGANTNLLPRGAGDMDSDGIPDIVLRNNNSGAVRIWTMNSDFTRKGNEYIRSSSNTNLELRGVVDINGDGNNDILNYNTSTGVLRAWIMDGYLVITENAEITQDEDLDWSVRGGGDDISLPTPVPEEKVTKLIKAESGGTVSLQSGISLYIPPDALNEDTNIFLGSIDITQFDGDVAVEGGVNGLHIIGAIFGPDRTLMNTPAKILFPLPTGWDPNDIPVLYETRGSDPAESLPSVSDTNVIIKEINGSYFAEIEAYHFSPKIISRNCHAGTIKRLIQSFEKRGCSRDEIFELVAKRFPDITVDENNAKFSTPKSTQAFIDTFFVDIGTYNQGEDIEDWMVFWMKQKTEEFRQVVLAFSIAPIFSEREGTNNFFQTSVRAYSHTATLGFDTDGTIQMYHTIARPRSSKWSNDLLVRLGGEYDYKYPWENINDYRTLRSGVPFELQVCGEPGCLSDPLLNEYRIDPYPILDKRTAGYPSVHIYVDNPAALTCGGICDITGRWDRVYSDPDCDGDGDILEKDAYVDFLDDGLWKEYYTTFEHNGTWTWDTYYNDWIDMKFDSIDYAGKKGGIWSNCRIMQIDNRMYTPEKTYRDLGYSSSCQVYER